MSGLIKDQGTYGNVVQVFVPNTRVVTNTASVSHGNVLRFTTAGCYEFDQDGVRVPYGAGTVVGVPYGITEVRLYDSGGSSLAAQIVEVM